MTDEPKPIGRIDHIAGREHSAAYYIYELIDASQRGIDEVSIMPARHGKTVRIERSLASLSDQEVLRVDQASREIALSLGGDPLDYRLQILDAMLDPLIDRVVLLPPERGGEIPGLRDHLLDIERSKRSAIDNSPRMQLVLGNGVGPYQIRENRPPLFPVAPKPKGKRALRRQRGRR